MASEVVWLKEARENLDEIIAQIAEASPAAARKYRSGLVNACRKLADFPRSGRRYNDLFRAVVYRNHIIFYQVIGGADRVHIVMVIDARRDVDGIVVDLLT
ncbi:MAG: type II toxin-antitoxin system RelE/ParE family toxin [Pseudomonadota bacterium]|jgi:plasmid stabilization system protein ParE